MLFKRYGSMYKNINGPLTIMQPYLFSVSLKQALCFKKGCLIPKSDSADNTFELSSISFPRSRYR